VGKADYTIESYLSMGPAFDLPLRDQDMLHDMLSSRFLSAQKHLFLRGQMAEDLGNHMAISDNRSEADYFYDRAMGYYEGTLKNDPDNWQAERALIFLEVNDELHGNSSPNLQPPYEDLLGLLEKVHNIVENGDRTEAQKARTMRTNILLSAISLYPRLRQDSSSTHVLNPSLLRQERPRNKKQLPIGTYPNDSFDLQHNFYNARGVFRKFARVAVRSRTVLREIETPITSDVLTLSLENIGIPRDDQGKRITRALLDNSQEAVEINNILMAELLAGNDINEHLYDHLRATGTIPSDADSYFGVA